MHVPRYTYLPLLIPEIRENLVELCLDDEQLESTKEAEWWFEEEPRGDRQDSFSTTGPCKWCVPPCVASNSETLPYICMVIIKLIQRHYPIDLLHLQSLISRPLLPSSHSSTSSDADDAPLRLILHLSNPPTDRLFLPNNPETCKQRFMNQLKEADLARWRNTSRVTALRKVELDAAWEGIVNGELCDVMLYHAMQCGPVNA